nr:hypothetical protein Iba_chr07aCG7400 [Ipomoea batatas]
MGLEDWNVWWKNSEAAMRMNGGSLYLVIYDFTIIINVTLNTETSGVTFEFCIVAYIKDILVGSVCFKDILVASRIFWLHQDTSAGNSSLHSRPK